MKKIVLLLVSVILTSSLYAQRVSVPTKAQIDWHERERMMFVCLDPATWQHREYDNHSLPLSRINPTKLDTDQWCETAVSWGAKTILFVAKHTGGFCWWDTKSVDYNVMNTPYGKDVLAQLATSCKKYDLYLGIYVYPGDEMFGAPIGTGGITKDPSMQEAQNKAFRMQLEETLEPYKDLVKEIWFDGSCKIPVVDIISRYTDKAVVFQSPLASVRWVGNEDGFAPYPNWYTLSKEDHDSGTSTSLHSDPDGEIYAPVEVNVPLLKNKGHKWFWAPDTDSLLLTPDMLVDRYYKSVGRGGIFLLNSTPDTTGLIPESHVAIYKEFGERLDDLFSNPLKTVKGGKLEIDFGTPTEFNQMMLREKVKYGQRVREYVLEASDDNVNWKTITTGTSVGYKRIELFEPCTARYVRVRIPKSGDTPKIHSLSLYDADIEYASSVNSGNPVCVGNWDSRNYSTDQWKTLEIDITSYVTDIGEYELRFATVAYDFKSKEKKGVKFSDWEVEMYGREKLPVIRYENGCFYITRSQQTLDEFKTIFKVKVKSEKAFAVGDINLRRIVY